VKKEKKMLQLERRQVIDGFGTSRGFSLLEMLVAMTVFLVIAGAAFSLFNRHLAFVTEQQNLSSVNIGMRNAMSQLELDLAAAGPNLFSSVQQAGTPVAPFSLGVIVRNNTPAASGACAPNANWAYPTNAACFDSLTIVNTKPCGAGSSPVLQIDDPGNSTESLSASSIVWGNNFNPGANLANDASCFVAGDEILVIQPSTGVPLTCDNGVQSNYCMGVVTLTKNAQVSGGKIQLQHNPTGAGSDPLGVIFNPSGVNNYSNANGLGVGYSNGAFIVNLGKGSNDITYAILPNPAVANDDQLMRCNGATCTAANAQVLADQVIGFKVGAILWDNYQTNATDDANFFYDASKYCSDAIAGADCSTTPPPANDPYDFTLIRAIRVSMVARTTPNADVVVLRNLRNGFDGGPYLVQQGSVAVDLRSITNSDILN
jgi:prepilin-type N-terminal cleavage/methylation domain-containing protein